jgi:hypothetical protein
LISKVSEKDIIGSAHDNGIKEGEHKKAMNIAVNMLKDGFSYEKIAAYTGLPMDEIKKIS